MFNKGSAAAVALPGARSAPRFMRRSKLAVTKALSHAEVAQCPEVQLADGLAELSRAIRNMHLQM